MIVIILKIKESFNSKLIIKKSKISFHAKLGNKKVLYKSILQIGGKRDRKHKFSKNKLIFLLRILAELWFCCDFFLKHKI